MKELIEYIAKSLVDDPSQVTADQLMDILRRLPSFHKAFFAPTLLG